MYSIDDMENIMEDMQDPDSPNIGPPPVAHFDIDESPLSEPRSSDPEITEYTRTENLGRPSKRSLEAFDDHEERTIKPAPPFEISMPPVISGSKRKFSATDEEESFLSGNITVDDGFEFSRSVPGPQKPKSSTAFEVSNTSHGAAGTGKVPKKKPNVPKRKVLEPSES
jgi:hypothetical protein